MKSETLSQFQSALYELDSLSTFGRGKDRAKRKARAQATTKYMGQDKVKGKQVMRAPGLPEKPTASLGQKVKTRTANASKAAGNWLGNPVNKAKAGFQTNSISAAAGKSQNAAIKSTASIGNTARKLGNAAKNVAGTRAGKIGVGLAAGGALAAGAAGLLRKKTKKNK